LERIKWNKGKGGLIFVQRERERERERESKNKEGGGIGKRTYGRVFIHV